MAIFGIGRARARAILDAVRVPYSKKVKELTDGELERIREAVSRFTVEGDLRREVQLSIKRLIDLGCYRACATARACRCGGSARAPMRARARVRARPAWH